MTHLYLANLCELSYHGPIPGGKRVVGSSFAVDVVPDDGGLVVVFRGTHELRDWTSNRKILPSRWRGPGSVHRGFLAAYDSMRLDLLEALYEFGSDPGRSLSVCGHSAGGALASLFALDHAPRIREVVTFGAPRCLDAVAVAQYNRLLAAFTTIYRNEADPVPYVIPRWWWFVHPDGSLRWWDGVQFRNTVSPIQYLWCLWSARRLFDGVIGDSIGDHRMSEYVSALSADFR
jgi:pimeloyl-ACP methyl ester carboxylesterase